MTLLLAEIATKTTMRNEKVIRLAVTNLRIGNTSMCTCNISCIATQHTSIQAGDWTSHADFFSQTWSFGPPISLLRKCQRHLSQQSQLDQASVSNDCIVQYYVWTQRGLGFTLSLDVTFTNMFCSCTWINFCKHLRMNLQKCAQVQHLEQHLAQAFLPRTNVTFAMPEVSTISAEQRQALAQMQNKVQAQLYMPHEST